MWSNDWGGVLLLVSAYVCHRVMDHDQTSRNFRLEGKLFLKWGIIELKINNIKPLIMKMTL